jgi:hypothetical protein
VACAALRFGVGLTDFDVNEPSDPRVRQLAHRTQSSAQESIALF